MNHLQIIYALEASKTCNFTQAAINLYVSQSALSRQITLLEKELGFSIFIRGKGKLSITPKGEKLLKSFQKYDEAHSQMEVEVKTIKDLSPDKLTIGFYEGFYGEELLSAVISNLKRKYADLSIQFTQIVRSQLKEMWDSIDVLMTVESELELIENFDYLQIGIMSMVVVISSSHPLAAKDNFNIDDLLSLPVFYIGAMTGMRCGILLSQMLMDISGKNIGEITKNWVTVPNITSMLLNIENGLGTGIFPDTWFIRSNPAVKCYSIEGIDEPAILAWKTDSSNELITSLINTVKD